MIMVEGERVKNIQIEGKISMRTTNSCSKKQKVVSYEQRQQFTFCAPALQPKRKQLLRMLCVKQSLWFLRQIPCFPPLLIITSNRGISVPVQNSIALTAQKEKPQGKGNAVNTRNSRALSISRWTGSSILEIGSLIRLRCEIGKTDGNIQNCNFPKHLSTKEVHNIPGKSVRMILSIVKCLGDEHSVYLTSSIKFL